MELYWIWMFVNVKNEKKFRCTTYKAFIVVFLEACKIKYLFHIIFLLHFLYLHILLIIYLSKMCN